MKKRKKSNNKINYWIVFLVIVLVISLVLSRSRRASRRAIYSSTVSQQTIIIKNVDKDKANQKSMYNIPEITKELLLGKVDSFQAEYMVKVDKRFASADGMFMQSDAYQAFMRMHEAAANEGINLVIISAMRTFDHQKRIWENKWNGNQKLFNGIYATDIAEPVERAKKILRYNAMPGTSRHHWGTDIDLNSLQNSYFDSGRGKIIYQWLSKNAASFGFCQPYTPHGYRRMGGYEEEKWHWSYKPVARIFIEEFQNIIDYDDITGFDGSETAQEINIIENYVINIDPSCKP